MPQPQEIHSRTEADEIAEQNVDAISQERFDAFAPNQSPTATWSHAHEVAAQLGTRAAHFVEAATGGRGAHDSESRRSRDEERQKVGLPPKFSN
jgi:hypothetical protein